MKILKGFVPMLALSFLIGLFISCSQEEIGDQLYIVEVTPQIIPGTYVQEGKDYNVYPYHPGDPLSLTVTISPSEIVGKPITNIVYYNVAISAKDTPINIPNVLVKDVAFNKDPKNRWDFDIDYNSENEEGIPFTIRLKGAISCTPRPMKELGIYGSYEYYDATNELEVKKMECYKPL